MPDKPSKSPASFEMLNGERLPIKSYAQSGPGRVVFSSKSADQAQRFIDRVGPAAESYTSVAEQPSAGALSR